MLIETAFDCHFEVLSLLGITAVKQLHQLLPFPGHDSALYCKTIYSEQPLLRNNLTYPLSLLSLNAIRGQWNYCTIFY